MTHPLVARPAGWWKFLLGALAAVPASALGLLVTGRVTEAGAVIQPAFLFDELKGDPGPSGPYTLQVLDPAGEELSSTSFDLATVVACGKGAGRISKEAFTVILPMTPETGSRMAALRLKQGDRTLAVRRSTTWDSGSGPDRGLEAAPIIQGLEPRAVALGKGEVRLTWDARSHPRVIVRHASGEIMAFAEDGSIDLHTDLPHLDLDLSDGLRSTRFRVKVTVPAPGPEPAAGTPEIKEPRTS